MIWLYSFPKINLRSVLILPSLLHMKSCKLTAYPLNSSVPKFIEYFNSSSTAAKNLMNSSNEIHRFSSS